MKPFNFHQNHSAILMQTNKTCQVLDLMWALTFILSTLQTRNKQSSTLQNYICQNIFFFLFILEIRSWISSLKTSNGTGRSHLPFQDVVSPLYTGLVPSKKSFKNETISGRKIKAKWQVEEHKISFTRLIVSLSLFFYFLNHIIIVVHV